MSSPVIECPICMDAIDVTKNSVVTDCGHTFHCSCLMQNAAHNGFGCPYCRAIMANEPPLSDELPLSDEEDEEEEEDDWQENQEISDNSLTSFRMFMQRLDGEEPEEEEEEEHSWESEDEDSDHGELIWPNSEYVATKLRDRGISYEDLVKNLLFSDHGYEDTYSQYESLSIAIYRQIKEISRHYEDSAIIPAAAPPTVPEFISDSEIANVRWNTNQDAIQQFASVPTFPEVAESKTVALLLKLQEFIRHD